jgi:4-hydroxybenzoate polyprenyltransferase
MQFLYTNIYGLLRTLRPRQWVKNGFVFIPLVFDQKLTDWPLLLRTSFAFILFCMISSTVYIINDLADIEKDKLHPKKRRWAYWPFAFPCPSGWTPCLALSWWSTCC